MHFNELFLFDPKSVKKKVQIVKNDANLFLSAGAHQLITIFMNIHIRLFHIYNFQFRLCVFFLFYTQFLTLCF